MQFIIPSFVGAVVNGYVFQLKTKILGPMQSSQNGLNRVYEGQVSDSQLHERHPLSKRTGDSPMLLGTGCGGQEMKLASSYGETLLAISVVLMYGSVRLQHCPGRPERRAMQQHICYPRTV